MRRPGGKAVPILDATHDFAHAVEDDKAWSESYYFNGYDPAVDAGLFTRIGVRPNEGTIDVILSVWLPGDRIAIVRGVRPQAVMTDDDLDVAGVRYTRIQPTSTWRITASAEAEVLDLPAALPEPDDLGDGDTATARLGLDLTFSALTPAIGTDGLARDERADDASAAAATTVGRGHFEQAGSWSGTVTLDGEEWLLDPASARGNRDKSWGPRRWGGPQMWRWFSVNIDDGTHFGGIRIGTPAGDLHRGWVWRDGEATSIRRWDVHSELADDGVTHRVTNLRATDKRGRVHELRGEILRVHGMPRRTGTRFTVVNEGLARWTYEGRTGYGISEYLHQLDDRGRPLVPIE
ncbi:MAG TPA: hypothetical protein VFI47_28610 [Acidimicrobiales bacterium]|nr:hypothetical protein [Acidimicrobiales bacterium]